MKKAIVFYNSKDINNLNILKKVNKVLDDRKISYKNISVFKGLKSKKNNFDFAISIGGDGTVLHASHYLVDMGIALIAIKSGSLGFLGSIEFLYFENFINDFLMGNYEVIERSMLELIIKNKTYRALNDVVIKSIDMRTFYTSVYLNDEFISTYFSDGVIISTPTGSTAYNLSVGGPIVHPSTSSIILTPISPHTLTHRPVVVMDSSTIKIKAYEKKRKSISNIVVVVDGQIILGMSEDFIKIRVFDKKFKMIVPEKYSYFDVLRKKLRWGERES